METSASFKARYAPLPYPTNHVNQIPEARLSRALQGSVLIVARDRSPLRRRYLPLTRALYEHDHRRFLRTIFT
jgi:hypothetical protein